MSFNVVRVVKSPLASARAAPIVCRALHIAGKLNATDNSLQIGTVSNNLSHDLKTKSSTNQFTKKKFSVSFLLIFGRLVSSSPLSITYYLMNCYHACIYFWLVAYALCTLHSSLQLTHIFLNGFLCF